MFCRQSTLRSTAMDCGLTDLGILFSGPPPGSDGGRAWWAHFAFTRINTTPTMLPKEIEDSRELGAFMSWLNP
jgi:hypothetical protein